MRIPEHKFFTAKPEPARTMVLRALDAALPITWVTADAAYSQERASGGWLSRPMWASS
ncbi:hypothetical protein [Streptomyces sp. NPDC057199]|uniref:hypothetical protein n=1 Tax=Streptomyces sp. NPDC057199 TaxID=3346047 RepID=UPI0036318433